jgi:large subunit ribosomal protein L29
MKYKEMKSMTQEDLNSKLVELRKELMKQNTQRATGTQLKNPLIIKTIRKDIARIMSLLKSDDKLVKKEGVKKHE